MDSDSDDDIFQGSGLNRRQEKAAEKAKEKQKSILDSALSDSKRLCTSAMRVSTLKKDSVKRDDDELRSRAEDLSQRFNKENMKELRNLDDVEGIDLSKQDQMLDRKRRLELALAIDTDQSTGWGRRSMVCFNPDLNPDLQFFRSEEESISALCQILSSCEKKHQFGPLEKVLVASIENNVLDCFLDDESSVARILKKSNVTTLNKDIFLWMKSTCLSAGMIRSQGFLRGVQANMNTIVMGGLCPPGCRTASVAYLSAELLVWINSSCAKTDNAILNGATRNIPGLVGLLQYWRAILRSSWDPSIFDPDDASASFVNICLLGLDFETSSSQSTRGIRGLIHQIVPLFLELTANILENYESWMDNTVESILKRLSILGPGEQGSDDELDSMACICHSLILQSIPMYYQDGTKLPHRLSNLFRAKLAIGALNSLSGGKASTLYPKYLLSESVSSICNKSFAAAVGGIMYLNSLGDELLTTAPLCPAIVECATVAFESGTIMMKLESDPNPSNAKCQAALVAKVLEHFDNHSFKLSKVLSGMTTNPHMRRAEYHMNVWAQFHRVYIKRAKSEAGEGETVLRQATLGFSTTKASSGTK